MCQLRRRDGSGRTLRAARSQQRNAEVVATHVRGRWHLGSKSRRVCGCVVSFREAMCQRFLGDIPAPTAALVATVDVPFSPDNLTLKSDRTVNVTDIDDPAR